MLSQSEGAVADLVDQHLCSRKACLLSIVTIYNNTGFLVFNVKSRHWRVMRHLLAHNTSSIVPGAEELLAKDWIKRLLFPFTLRNTAGKWTIQGRNEPFDCGVEALFWRFWFADTSELNQRIYEYQTSARCSLSFSLPALVDQPRRTYIGEKNNYNEYSLITHQWHGPRGRRDPPWGECNDPTYRGSVQSRHATVKGRSRAKATTK